MKPIKSNLKEELSRMLKFGNQISFELSKEYQKIYWDVFVVSHIDIGTNVRITLWKNKLNLML